MTSSALATESKTARKRKSRHGCRNCKLRKLKCDETKPFCLRCRSYGVQCNFGFDVPDFQPLCEQRKDKVVAKRKKPCSPQIAVSSAMWTSDGITVFVLDAVDQGLLGRFKKRTLFSVGGPAMEAIYDQCLFAKMFEYPFMMHGTLAVAAAHDRFSRVTSTNTRSLRESYHWAQCTTLLNRWLNQPLREEDKDPIWGTAGMIGILTFASTLAQSTEEAWPLAPSDSADLEWLRLGKSKMALWKLVDPMRPGSIFQPMFETFTFMLQPERGQGDIGIPTKLAKICGLSHSSTADNNPYFSVAHCLSPLLAMPEHECSFGRALTVSNRMHGEFERLLMIKDPVALLLLALWYAKARKVTWWMQLRITHELPAICTYLERHHKDNVAIQELIPWEGAKCCGS